MSQPTETPPNPPQNPPENQPPAQPQNTPQPAPMPNNAPSPQATAHAATADLLSARTLQDMRTELAALPERIVNAIREGTQPPQHTNTPDASANPTPHSPGGGDPNRTPSTKFADWWFGK